MNADSQSDPRLMPRKSVAIRRKTSSDASTRGAGPELASRARTRSAASATADPPSHRRSAAAKPRLRDDFRSYARVAILSAAEEVLAEEGLHAARIEEIAQRARVAVGTIYNLVGDRDALVREIMRARQTEVVAALANTLKSRKDEPLRAQVHAAAVALFEYFRSHSRFFRLVMESEPGGGHAKLGTPANSKHATMLEIHKLFRELIQRGVQRGELRASGSELFPAMLGGMLRAVMLLDLMETDPPSAESRADAVTRMFLEGAGP
jgi:AcrR family transcriptional regulator